MLQKAKKAVILARVSSTEQEYGKSIQAQLDICREYAKNNNLDVIKEFDITESSSNIDSDRAKFYQMIDFVKKQKETIAIIAHSVDRLQRRFQETIVLEPMINKGKIELHIVISNLKLCHDSPSAHIMLWDFNAVAARAYIHQLKDATKRGRNKKIQDGEWPARAPLGYLNYTENHRNKIKIDPLRAPLIKKMFEDYSTGTYSIDAIYKRMLNVGLTTSGGKPLSKSNAYFLLTNPFYCGFMNIKEQKIPHKYGNIIDKALFDKCQSLRACCKHNKFKYASLPFTFRGLIRCKCGRMVTSEIKKSKYTYLRCTKYKTQETCDSVLIHEEIAYQAVLHALRNLKVDNDLAELMRKYLEEQNKLGVQEQIKELEGIKKELSNNKQRTDRLLESYLNNATPENIYKAKIAELQEEKLTLESRQEKIKINDADFAVSLNEVLYLTTHAEEILKSSKVDGKRLLINCVLSNLILDGQKIKFTYRKPFDILAKGYFFVKNYPQEESNFYPLLRRQVLYPLSYGGV